MTLTEAVRRAMQEHGTDTWLTTAQIAATVERHGEIGPERAARRLENACRSKNGELPDTLDRKIVLGYREMCSSILAIAASDDSRTLNVESKPHPDDGRRNLWRLVNDTPAHD